MKFDFAWLRRRRVERDVRAEFAEHLRARAADLERTGLTPREARRRARLEFGNPEAYQEQVRAAAGILSLETLRQDVRFGLRLLRKSPGFTVTAALMLALGIGANAAIFSMVDWVMLRPLPVSQPGQLTYLVAANDRGGFSNGYSYPNYADIRAQTGGVFTGLAAVIPFQTDGLTVHGVTSTLWTNCVSGNFFTLLGIHPALGRLFQPGEGENADAPAELVLSYSYWQSHFGGDRGVIGRRIAVDGRAATIVGVAERGFHGAIAVLDAQGFLPLDMNSGPLLATASGGGDFFHDRRDGGALVLMARRRAGVSLAQVQPALQVVAKRMAAEYPKDDRWRGMYARQLTSEPIGANESGGPDPLKMVAGLFLALAGLVLLLACINIASLLLARAAVRRRELAVRAALGASRGRLLRQMLLESLLLALLGGASGLGIALAACAGLNRLPLSPSLPVVLSFGLNWHVFAYTAAMALTAGIAVGLMPAWQASRLPPAAVLHAGAKVALGGRTRLRSLLVIAEIGGSAALLIVAGLFARSLGRAQTASLGFEPTGVVNLQLDAHDAGYGKSRGLAFDDALLARVRALPGVASASLAAAIPFGNYSYGEPVTIPGRKSGGRALVPGYNSVTPGYFATLGIRLLRGRGFRAGDGAESPRVAVINEAMAGGYWPDTDAIGHSFTFSDDPGHPVMVVGIVTDSRTESLSGPIGPYMYLPLAQSYNPLVALQIRTSGASLASLTLAARGQIAALAPAMPILEVQTMSDALHSVNGLGMYQLGAGLAGAMGLLGLLMAVIGVYGVVAYSASQRTQEIGLRFALGARRGQVLGLVLRQGMLLALAGVALGILIAAGLSQVLAKILTGVGPFDPLTYLSATLVIAAAALAASFVPALRVLRTDPAIALRCE